MLTFGLGIFFVISQNGTGIPTSQMWFSTWCFPSHYMLKIHKTNIDAYWRWRRYIVENTSVWTNRSNRIIPVNIWPYLFVFFLSNKNYWLWYKLTNRTNLNDEIGWQTMDVWADENENVNIHILYLHMWHSIHHSTHELIVLRICRCFWERKCLDPRGTSTPNFRIHADCSTIYKHLLWWYKYFCL